MTASTETTCAVCGQPAEELASAICGECDRPFHLNQRNDVDGVGRRGVDLPEHGERLSLASIEG